MAWISCWTGLVFQHCILILFTGLGLLGLVPICVSVKGFWFSLTSRCPFNMVLGSTDTILHCQLDCRVLARRYGWRAVMSGDFALLNDEDSSVTEYGHGKLVGESLSEQSSGRSQSCCQRAAVRGFLSEWPLSESCCRRVSVRVAAVKVAAVGELLSEGFCQSGHCQRAAARGLLSEWLLSESKSATKILHTSVLVNNTARHLPNRQNSEILRKRPKIQQS